MYKNFRSACLFAIVLATSAHAGASIINVQFAGQWLKERNVHNNSYSQDGPVISAPVDFTVTLIFNTTAYEFRPQVFPFQNPDGTVTYWPSIYSNTYFSDVSGNTSTTAYSVFNPYAANGVRYSSGLSAEYTDWAKQVPDITHPTTPTVTYTFSSGQSSSTQISGGSANWDSFLRLQSPPESIAPSAIGSQNASDYKAFFQNAMSTGMQFDTQFGSTTYLIAPWLFYPDAIYLTGNARVTAITEVSEVPEPCSSLLFGIAAVTAVFVRSRASRSRA